MQLNSGGEKLVMKILMVTHTTVNLTIHSVVEPPGPLGALFRLIGFKKKKNEN